MGKTYLYLILVLILSSLVLGFTETEVLTHINETNSEVNIDYVDTINKNIKISDDNSSIEFFNILNPDDIGYIYLNPNLNFDTSGVSIYSYKNITFDYATVILTKNKPLPINTVIYSEDGYNFTKDYSIKYYQNRTHVWFNVSHFSSWTATIGDISIPFTHYIIFDVDDYATLDPGDYVCVQYGLGAGYGEICNDAGLESDTATTSGSVDAYFVAVDSTNSILIDADESYSDLTSDYTDKSFNVLIRNSGGSLDIFESLDVTITEFEPPDVDTNTETNVGDTTATLNGDVDFKDQLDDITCGFVLYEYIDYEWVQQDISSFDQVLSYASGEQDFDADLTGLTPGAAYLFSAQCDYEGGSGFDTGGTEIIFATTGGDTDPTVETIGSNVGDGYAEFKALVDFGTYSGGDIGLAFNYSVLGADSWTKVPSGGSYEAPSDGVLLTTNQITGLSNGVDYEFFSYIVWDSGTQIDIGDTAYFTPNPPSSNNSLTSDLIAYYSFDSGTTDDYASFDLTNSGAVQTTGKLSNGYFFDNSDDDYIEISTLGNITSDVSVQLWADIDSMAQFVRLFDWRETSDTNSFEIRGDSSSTVLVRSFGQSSATHSFSGGFHHYIVTLDFSDNIVELWVDGVNVIDSDLTGTPSDLSGYFALGNYHGGGFSMGLDGIIDEVGIWNKILSSDEISDLYNDGDGLSFDDFTSVSLIPTTLEPDFINYNSANVRGTITFNESIYSNTNASFEYKEVGASSFTPIQPFSVNSDEIFDYLLTGLTPSTHYEFRADIQYNTSEANYVGIGNSLYFNTTAIPEPDITTLSAVNVTNNESVLSGNVNTFYGWDSVDLYFNYTKDGESNYTTISIINDTDVVGNYYYTLTGLESETEYLFKFFADYNGSIVSGLEVQFETTEEGAPQINTIDSSFATPYLKRTTARLYGELNDLGDYPSIELYFHYYNTTDDFNTTLTEYTSDGVTVFEDLAGLIINGTYSYELIAKYGGDRTVSGGIYTFKTLSLLDYIDPFVEILILEDSDIGSDSVTTGAFVTLEDTTNVSLFFVLYDYNDDTVEISPDYVLFNDTTISNPTYHTFYNLTSDTPYSIRAYISYIKNDTEYFQLSGLQEFRTLDVTSAPKFVNIIGSWEFYVDNPPLFFVMILVGISLLVLSFGLGNLVMSAEADYSKINKFLPWGALTFSLLFIVWSKVQLILPTWEFTIMIVSLFVFGGYFFLESSRGGVYG